MKDLTKDFLALLREDNVDAESILANYKKALEIYQKELEEKKAEEERKKKAEEEKKKKEEALAHDYELLTDHINAFMNLHYPEMMDKDFSAADVKKTVEEIKKNIERAKKLEDKYKDLEDKYKDFFKWF